MATKGKDPGKSQKVQATQAKHTDEYAKHEADLEGKTAKAHVKASNAKVAIAAKSASQVKEILARAVEDKKSTAELVKIALDGISKIATIEKNEAKEVDALNKRLTAAKIQHAKEDNESNRKLVKALEEEFATVLDYYEKKSGEIFDKFKAVQNQHSLNNSKIGKQIAASLMKDRVEQAKTREKDFLESRRETMRQLALKLDVAKATGNEELQKLLKQQAKEAKNANIAAFDELQKEIERRLDDSDTATQKAFQQAEKLAAKQGFFSKKIDSAKDALNISSGAKNLVGKIGVGGYTIGNWQATKRAKDQIAMEDMFAKRHKDEEEAKKRWKENPEETEEAPDAANPFAFHKESARGNTSADSAEAELQKMENQENARAETEELKGINKSLATIAKEGASSGSSSALGGAGLVGDLISKVAGIGAGISSIVGILGTVALAVAPLAAMYAVTKWAETASIRDKKGNMTGTGKVLEKTQKALGGQGLKPQQDMTSVERLNADTTFASTLGISSDLFGTKKKALIKKYQWQFESGATFSPEEAAVLKKNLGLDVPPQNIKKPGGTKTTLPSTGAGGGRGNAQAQQAAMDRDKASAKVPATTSATAAATTSAAAASAAPSTSGAGGGRGNAQAQQAAIASNGGSDGKSTSISGPGSEKLQNLVTTSGNVDLADLTPQATANLTNMASDYNSTTGKKLKINSGFRSREKQAQLYADYKAGKPGANPANPPGSSLHEVGLAVDIDPSQVDEMDRMGLIAKNGFERISGPKERQHIQLAGAQSAISSGTNFVSGDALGAGKSSTLSAGESFVDAPSRSAPSNTSNDKISVASSGDTSNTSTSVQGPSNGGAGGGRGSGGAPNKGSPISVTSVPTFMFVDPAFYATNVQAMA